MNTYLIWNPSTGETLGKYKGDTPLEALGALARDAGYRDYKTLPSEVATSELRVDPA